jgi:hypothetical protein
MSLTVLLMLLGLAVLAALAFQLWWSARHRSPLYRPFAQTVSDPLRQEPSWGPAGEADGATEPSADGVADGGLRYTPPRRALHLDALIDVIVPLAPESPVSGELAMAHLPSSRRAGTKPMLIEGQEVASGQWECPTHDRRYRQFQAGVQLANRSGPLNEIEYSEFVQKVQRFAEGIGAMADFPDMLEVVARARELDQFASGTDAQLSLVLRANGPAWSVGYLQQAAARLGFVPGALPGRLVLPGLADGDPPMLVLGFDAQTALADDPQAALRQVTLSLDVAQTPAVAAPFQRWRDTALRLCEEIEASAMDENGVPLTAAAFDTIADELGRLYAHLETRDLAAGTPAARRLFS